MIPGPHLISSVSVNFSPDSNSSASLEVLLRRPSWGAWQGGFSLLPPPSHREFPCRGLTEVTRTPCPKPGI